MRARVAGCAALLMTLLSACGGGEDQVKTADPKPVPTQKRTGEAGVDGRADPRKVFTEAELKAALLPAKEVGPKARAYDVTTGLSGLHYADGDWGSCAPGKEAREELARLRGNSAGQTVRPFPGAIEDEDPFVHVSLVSMPVERAKRHVALRRQLNDACPRVTVDTEAAPVEEHHTAGKLADLGDEAIVESTRTTGGDEYDGIARHKVEVRVGGVLVLVNAGTDKDVAVLAAAKAAAHVRTDLYKTS
ncbi:hypothetical protein AB0Q95_25185 [Streptomyces sp. NPDC059900]|uniref:hypothetical protein n=1 Tax=Streptomyces sp. NPDC059900 TaxID=3155816 RepID=UPI00342260ED